MNQNSNINFNGKFLFAMLEKYFSNKISKNSVISFQLLLEIILQEKPILASLGITQQSLLNYSRGRLNNLNQISKGFGSKKVDLFGKPIAISEAEKLIEALCKSHLELAKHIFKKYNVSNRVLQFQILDTNAIWYYDFTTFSMLQSNNKTEVLFIQEAASGKILGFEVYDSKRDITSEELIFHFEKVIEKHGTPMIIHSDSDAKNHSIEMIEWYTAKGIIPSITIDHNLNIFPAHGNQVIERYNGTIKSYCDKQDPIGDYKFYNKNELREFLFKVVDFYNNKEHQTLKDSPNNTYFQLELLDCCGTVYHNYKFEQQNSTALVPANVTQTALIPANGETIAQEILNTPEMIQSFQAIDPLDSNASQKFFNVFLNNFGLNVYETGGDGIKKFFDLKFPMGVGGPGREGVKGANFISLQEAGEEFADLSKEILSILAIVINEFFKKQTDVLMFQNETNKNEILAAVKAGNDQVVDSLKNEIQNSQEQISKLQIEILELKELQCKAQEGENQLGVLGEKRKNRELLPLGDPVVLNEFHAALEIAKDIADQPAKQGGSMKAMKYNAARDGIALYILYFSGLGVANLLSFTLNDIETIFLSGSQVATSVQPLKKKGKVLPHGIMLSKAVLNTYVFGNSFNLLEDLKTLQLGATEFVQKEQLDSNLQPPFYASFGKPFKKADRVTVTNNINVILKQISDQYKVNTGHTKILSSHSFRINVVTQIIRNFDIEEAGLFVAHESIETTSGYNRSVIDNKKLRDISGILADTRSGKKHSKSVEQDYDDSYLQAKELLHGFKEEIDD